MAEPATLMELSTGGILAVLLVKEVLAFIQKTKNGKTNGGTPAFCGESRETHEYDRKRREEAWTSIGDLIQGGDTRIAMILENQTEILKDLTTMMASLRRDVEIVGKDLDRHLTILSEDVLRRLETRPSRTKQVSA